jgi:hypothetical protein
MSATGSISWTCWHLNPIHVMGGWVWQEATSGGKDWAFDRAIKRSGRAMNESASAMEVEFVSCLRLPLRKLSELAGGMDYTAAGVAVSRFHRRLSKDPKLSRLFKKIQELSNVEM